ncbi:hypothetical protein ACLOJK_030971 [Asimina triloba]
MESPRSGDLPSRPLISPAITEANCSQLELAIADFLGIDVEEGATQGSTLGLENLSLQDAQEGSMSERENFHIPRAKTSIEQSIGNSKGSSQTRSSQAPTLDLREAARIGSPNHSQMQIRRTSRGNGCHACQSNPLIPNPSMRIQGHRNFGNSSIPLEDFSISGGTTETRASSRYPVDIPKTETMSHNPSTLVDLRDGMYQGHFSYGNSALGWEENHFSNRQAGEIERSDYPQAPISSVFQSFRTDNTPNRLQGRDQGSRTRNFLSNGPYEERVPSNSDIEMQGITGNHANMLFSGTKPVDIPSKQWAKIILLMATNHTGSDYLQETLDTREPRAIKRIFDGVLECVVDLIIDRFGNSLLQKLITKLINIIKWSFQLVEVMMAAIAPGLLVLMTNKNGSQMIDKCLFHFSNKHNQVFLRHPSFVALQDIAGPPAFAWFVPEPRLLEESYSDFNYNILESRSMILSALAQWDTHTTQHDFKTRHVIFETIQEHCIDLAKDAVAYLRIQRAVQTLADPYRQVLLIRIVNEALQLAQDVYGNYIIQEVISLQIPELTKAICHVLRGHFANLSMNKYGSHVVEKCIKSPCIDIVINEFVCCDKLADVACDYFGNYVLQTALRTAKDDLSHSLVRAIEKHRNRLLIDKHGEKVLREWANTSALLQFQKVI